MTTPVTLYVYDLSNGLAKTISPFVLGRRIEGLWHTAIVVFGNEYFFGGHGIACCVPGTTQLGEPLKKELLGLTAVTQDVFEDFLIGYSNSKFHGSSYNLLENNCNNFSDEVSKFLVGKGIDEDIVSLPQRVLSSPMGPLLKGHLEKMSNVAPTDGTRNLSSANTSIPHSHTQHSNGSGLSVTQLDNGTNLYFPCFSTVTLGEEETAAIAEVDPFLATTVQQGPLTADDLALLCRLHEKDKRVFGRVAAILSQKRGFIRLSLGDGRLYNCLRDTIAMATELGVQELPNNYLAGLNQAERSKSEITEMVTVSLTQTILNNAPDDSNIDTARMTYNLAGSQLSEDQVFELGGALIHSLPNTPPPAQNTEETDLFLKSLFLLMIKNRQVAELCSAMEKDFSEYKKNPQLQGIVLKIIEMQQ